MASTPSISVIVISRNEGENLRSTVENLEATLPANADVVVVDDASVDGSADFLRKRRRRTKLLNATGIGVTRARNLGARSSAGKVIIFADAHLRLQADWWRPLIDQLQQPKVGAVAPVVTSWSNPGRELHGMTFPGPDMEIRWLSNQSGKAMAVPILPGCCLAMRRDVFQATGGWDEGMLGRGNVDNELSVRLWLLGYELRVTPDSTASHFFRPKSPYSVRWPQFLHNRLRLAFVHLNPLRLRKVVAALRFKVHLGAALLLIAQSDAVARRQELQGQRIRDDNWLFERFKLTW